jgi:DNA-directed RNA polymerase subunit beta'
MSLERKDAMNTGTIFNDTNEVLKAYANGYVHLHTRPTEVAKILLF